MFLAIGGYGEMHIHRLTILLVILFCTAPPSHGQISPGNSRPPMRHSRGWTNAPIAMCSANRPFLARGAYHATPSCASASPQEPVTMHVKTRAHALPVTKNTLAEPLQSCGSTRHPSTIGLRVSLLKENIVSASCRTCHAPAHITADDVKRNSSSHGTWNISWP